MPRWSRWKTGSLVAIAVVALVALTAFRETFQANYYRTTALAASGVVSTTRGYVLAVHGYNNLAETQFIQFFNSATVPADATVPFLVLQVEASKNFYFDTTDRGIFFNTGIAWSNSTTLATKTIGAGNVWMQVEYTNR